MKIIITNTHRIISLITFTGCLLIIYLGDEQPTNTTVILSMVAFFYLGYISRRPHPNEKTLFMWLKICILKLQIWPKQFYLFWYPDLKKYRGKETFKAKIKVKRIELREAKKELKKLK